MIKTKTCPICKGRGTNDAPAGSDFAFICVACDGRGVVKK